MAIYIYWFGLALLLLAMEMATGTFYLLMLGAAAVVGGLAAFFRADPVWQYALSALAVMAGTIILRRWKGRSTNVDNNNLDVGQPVKVLDWGEDGTVRVFYRGATWDAEIDGANTPHEKNLYIKAMKGSKVILTHIKP